MFSNLLKVAVRSFKRHKLYSIVNIAGLTVGITASLILIIYVMHERSFDTFHQDYQRIFRVNSVIHMMNEDLKIATSPGPLGSALSEFKEVDLSSTIYSKENLILNTDSVKAFEDKAFINSGNFFDIFNFKMVAKSDQFFGKDGTIILTLPIAGKYFPGLEAKNVIGKEIIAGQKDTLIVSAITEKLPSNTHLDFNAIIHQVLPEDSAWTYFNKYTYLKLANGTDNKAVLETSMDNIFDLYMKEFFKGSNYTVDFYLQPVEDIYLSKKQMGEIGEKGNRAEIYIFLSIAIFMLIMVAINYTNVTTARSFLRGKEIGVRKALGSSRNEILAQFLLESFLLILLATLISLTLIELITPYLQRYTGNDLSLNIKETGPILIVIILTVTLLGGIYPAISLSGFKPTEVLKGKKGFFTSGSAAFRKALVIFQFSLSLVMIIMTIIVFKQVNYLKEKPLGFNQTNLVSIDFAGIDVKDEFLDDLFNCKFVASAGSGTLVPGMKRGSAFSYYFAKEDTIEEKIIQTVVADQYYIQSLELNFINGENFDPENDSIGQFIINESLSRQFDGKPIGKKIYTKADYSEYGIITGVVNDFHLLGLQKGIEPLCIKYHPRNRYLLTRLKGTEIEPAITHVENIWLKHYPAEPLDIEYIDRIYDSEIDAEISTAEIFGFFSGISLLLACMGLFGLSSFNLAQKRREIGIKKAIGAEYKNIFVSFNKEYIVLAFISSVISWPIAYFIVMQWLDNFTYKTSIDPMIFLIASIFSILLVMITIGYHAVRAVRTDPIKAIKYQ